MKISKHGKDMRSKLNIDGLGAADCGGVFGTD